MTDEQPDPVAIQKIAAGHEQVAEARMADHGLLQYALERAQLTERTLTSDMETLAAYGFKAPTRFREMARDAVDIVKGLEHAVEVTKALVANNRVLTPEDRRNGP